ncbi:MAG: DUF3857 and transglutaminase domain-containing protein [Bacteroidales bacterium]|nr:DUF3857 and transglutaminase domain-containing protein [Bacteroidales bacterium]MBP5326869.1 DUF3857 and transglutaminase domain-containing protein [Bacteroidales bacterium]
MSHKLSLLFLAMTVMMSAIAQNADNVTEPQKYKGCQTLTEFDSTTVFMEESGLSLVYGHKRIHMLDYAGCSANSVVKMDYDPLSAYVEIQKVLVHRYYSGKTDTIVANGKGTVYDYIAPARLIYWGASQKMVEVGHLDPRDILEIWTFRKGFTYALLADDDSRYIPPMRGHFYDIVPFWSDQPIQDKVYSANVLTSKKLRFSFYNDMSGVSMDSTIQGDRTIFIFRRHDIMPLKHEPAALADNDMQCKLLLSTAPNWESKSMWFYGVNESYGSFKSTPEVSAKVRELLKNAKNELDSISILTHWVADNIRYCGISMGEGEGYTLHNAKMNFTDRCGVCKDKAGMLVTMLRAAGFKSYAAMTMAHERIDRIPADQFNHSVCVVQRRNGMYQLLDPTWVPGVRELWSSAEQQQGYLMGLPNGADLMETPTSPAENHYLRIIGDTKIAKDGTLTGTITISAEGQSDAAVRGVFKARQSEWRRNLELELLRIAPNANIKKINYTDEDHYLDQPVRITYTFAIPNYAIVNDDDIIFIPLTARNLYSRAMGHLNFDTTATHRSQPFSDRCSRLVEIRETITLPAEYKTMTYNQQIEGVASPAVNYGCGFQLEGNKLIFGENAMYNKRVYDAADWPAYRQAVRNQKVVASTPVLLKK